MTHLFSWHITHFLASLRNAMLIWALAILMICGVGSSAQAQLFITNLTAQPNSASVNPTGATSIAIRWRIEVFSTTPGSGVLTSPFGTIIPGGTLGGVVNRSFRHSGSGAEIFTVMENLMVNRSVAAQIAGAGNGFFSREFQVAGAFPGSPLPATVTLTPSPSGQLSFHNIALRFDTGGQFARVDGNAALSAHLDVATNGRGIFRGHWEISGPGSAGGSFRRLPGSHVVKMLSGAGRTHFESPALPTARAGIYRVRFLQNGVSSDDALTITYSVGQDRGRNHTLQLLAPSVNAGVDSTTVFRWENITNATRYRVEFYTNGTTDFTSHRQIAAHDSPTATVQLRSFTLSRLPGHGQIWWRVVAFDNDGNAISASPGRRLQ